MTEFASVSLSELAEIYSGYAFKSSDLVESDGTPVIKIANIQDRQVLGKCSTCLPDRLFSPRLAKYVLKRGDILVAMTGAGSVGRIGKMRRLGQQYLVNQRVGIIRVKPLLASAEFVYQAVSTSACERALFGLATGAGQPNLSPENIGRLQVPFPSIEIQEKIAGVLAAYDDLVDSNTRHIGILEEMARMLYREWFVEYRFPGYENCKMVDSQVGKVPEAWKVVPSTSPIAVDPPTKVPKEGKKPFVPMGSLMEATMLVRNIETREGNSGSKFKNGDTLFARITPCLENGKTGFVQFLESDSDVAFGSTEFIVLRSRTLSPEYVYLMARSDKFRDNAIKSMSGATGRQRVQDAAFDRFLLAHPTAELIRAFSEVVQPMFGNIHNLASRNDNLRQTRDLLLPKLISGEIDVSDLDIATGEAA